MTTTQRPYDNRFAIGFDRIFDHLMERNNDLFKTVSNYPPYNIKKTADNKYVIELAVAGFDKQDIEITLEDDTLVINSNLKTEETEGDGCYLFHGIAKRNFKRAFSLADNIVINNASLTNGLLRIWLESIIPEYKKPRKIDIVDENNNPEFLQEDNNANSN